MADNKTIDHNATPPADDGGGLRGGTQGGRVAPLADPNHMPSEAVVGFLGGQADGGGAGGESLEAMGDGPRRRSGADVQGLARDAAHPAGSASHSGQNEGDPAAERKAGRSPGNMTHLSGHDPNDPANPAHPASDANPGNPG